jgi:hypothetical protein
MVVCLPAQRAAVHADGPWCTWMYETRNETEPAGLGCDEAAKAEAVTAGIAPRFAGQLW